MNFSLSLSLGFCPFSHPPVSQSVHSIRPALCLFHTGSSADETCLFTSLSLRLSAHLDLRPSVPCRLSYPSSVSPPLCLSVFLSVCTSVLSFTVDCLIRHLSIHLSVSPPLCLSVPPSLRFLSTVLSVIASPVNESCLCISPSVYLSFLPFCLCIAPSVFPSSSVILPQSVHASVCLTSHPQIKNSIRSIFFFGQSHSQGGLPSAPPRKAADLDAISVSSSRPLMSFRINLEPRSHFCIQSVRA